MPQRRIILPALVMVAAVVCGSCTSSTGTDPQRGPEPDAEASSPMVVASFSFSESRVLAEIYALVLEAGGYPVTRRFNLGSREIVEPALFQDKVDLVPEYLGSALEFASLSAAEGTSDPRIMHRKLSRALSPKGVEVLAHAPAQDQNAVAVTASTAARYGLRKVSDLKGIAPELAFGGPPECPETPLCLRGLGEKYGLEFKSFVSLDAAGPVTVTALDNGEVDVAAMFTTSPSIPGQDFVLLEDDQGLQPAESVVPVIRREMMEVHGTRFVAILNRVTRRLSTQDLRLLNKKVELEGVSPASAARAWLRAEGLGS